MNQHEIFENDLEEIYNIVMENKSIGNNDFYMASFIVPGINSALRVRIIHTTISLYYYGRYLLGVQFPHIISSENQTITDTERTCIHCNMEFFRKYPHICQKIHNRLDLLKLELI